jgi:hypothetical protein
MTEDQPKQFRLQMIWVGVDDAPILFVNQMLGQVDDHGEIILTFGQAAPPVTLGTPEQQAEQMQAAPFVQVRPVSRLSLPKTRAEELVRVLQKTLENHQRMIDFRATQEAE